MRKIVRFRIQDFTDREAMVTALANSGYMVSTEVRREGFDTSYFVVVDCDVKEPEVSERPRRMAL